MSSQKSVAPAGKAWENRPASPWRGAHHAAVAGGEGREDARAAAAVVEDLERRSLGGGGDAGAEGALHAAVHGGDDGALGGDAEPLPDRIGSDVGGVPFGALGFRPLISPDRTWQVMYGIEAVLANVAGAASSGRGSLAENRVEVGCQ